MMKFQKLLVCARLSLAGLLTLALDIPTVLHADTPTIVDTSPVGTIDGFDLYGHGIYWWTFGNEGDEATQAQDGILASISSLPGAFLNQRGSRTVFLGQSRHIIGPANGSIHTDSDLFFFGNSSGLRLLRRPMFGTTPDNLGTDYSGVAYDQAGAMIQFGSYLIWSAVQGGQSQVRMKALNGPAGSGDQILFTDIGLATKMALATLTVDPSKSDFTYLILLTDGGALYKYVVDPPVQRTGPDLVADHIADMTVRREVHRLNLVVGFKPQVSEFIYAATGKDLTANRASGKLLSFNLLNNVNATVYDSGSPDQQFTAVGQDGGRLFLTQTHVLPGGGIAGPSLDVANSQILRQDSPADDFLAGLPKGNFQTIAIGQEGRNLRSDGQWLYWANGNQIRKLPTDTPAIELDFQALGLEAVQTVQDYNNSIPLVQFKGTIVRGYANVVKNSGTGLTRFNLSAQLRGYLNGTELPDSPAYPYHYGQINTASDLPTLRTNLNRSFNFQMPDSWLAHAGSLRLEFRLDPQGTSLETGAAAQANNTATATLNIVRGHRPAVVFKAMSATTANYDMSAPNSGFGNIVDRANSMLPVDHLKVFFSPGSITKPVVTLLGIKGRPFSMPDDANEALTLLELVEEFSDDPPGTSDVHWAGMFPADIGNFNGLGQSPGNSLILRMDPISSRGGTWGSIIGGHSLSHELSHNYGRKHINQTTSGIGCGTDKPLGPYDVEPPGQDPCTLGVTDLTQAVAPIGYDWLTDTLIPPNAAADMMTYGSPRWASPFTFQAVEAAMPETAPAEFNSNIPNGGALKVAGAALDAGQEQPHGPIFSVSGTIFVAQGTAVLLPASQLPAGTLSSAKVDRSLVAAAALGPNAPYQLRLIGDPQAAPLFNQPVAVTESPDGDSETLQFSQVIPFLPGVTKIQLLGAGAVLAEIQASAHAPVLQLQAPQFDPTTHSLTLNWTASDADGDGLYFTTQFSHDNGSTWHTVQVHDPELGAALDTTLLPGGDQCRLRVLATDGLNTAIGVTDPFALPKHAPVLSIHGIQDQQQFPQSAAIFAQIMAYDPEEGSLDPSAVQWTLSGLDPRSGTGDSFSLRGLAPGSYELDAKAADAEGNSGSAAVHFQVQPIQIPDGPAPVLDGLAADEAYDTAPLVPIHVNSGNRVPTNVRFVHSAGYLYVSFSGLDYTSSANLPASVGLYLDLKATGDTNAQPADIGFGINEDGVLTQVAGNGTSMAVTPVSSGFTGQIALGNTSWSAELRIADSLLGGWNHVAGMMLAHYFPNLIGQAKIWPQAANVDHPSTWTKVSLGLQGGSTGPRLSVAVSSGAGSGGLQIVSGPGVFDRQDLATDTTQNDYGWIGAGATPVTYSVDISKFPAAAGDAFQGQIFLVPNSTGSVSPDYDEPSVAMLDIRSNTDGSASAWFRYKINDPMSNDFLYLDGTLGEVDCTTGPLGTWSITFLNDSAMTMTAPGGTSTHLSFPDAAAARSAFAGKVTAYFGNQANDASQIGQATVFSRISIQGTPRAPAIDESFPGPDLNQHPQPVAWSWLKLAESASGISILNNSSAGLAVSWTLPDDGFVLQFSPTLQPAAWKIPTLQNVTSQGGWKMAFIPKTSLPSFNGGYFRLFKAP